MKWLGILLALNGLLIPTLLAQMGGSTMGPAPPASRRQGGPMLDRQAPSMQDGQMPARQDGPPPKGQPSTGPPPRMDPSGERMPYGSGEDNRQGGPPPKGPPPKGPPPRMDPSGGRMPYGSGEDGGPMPGDRPPKMPEGEPARCGKPEDDDSGEKDDDKDMGNGYGYNNWLPGYGMVPYGGDAKDGKGGYPGMPPPGGIPSPWGLPPPWGMPSPGFGGPYPGPFFPPQFQAPGPWQMMPQFATPFPPQFMGPFGLGAQLGGFGGFGGVVPVLVPVAVPVAYPVPGGPQPGPPKPTPRPPKPEPRPPKPEESRPMPKPDVLPMPEVCQVLNMSGGTILNRTCTYFPDMTCRIKEEHGCTRNMTIGVCLPRDCADMDKEDLKNCLIQKMYEAQSKMMSNIASLKPEDAVPKAMNIVDTVRDMITDMSDIARMEVVTAVKCLLPKNYPMVFAPNFFKILYGMFKEN